MKRSKNAFVALAAAVAAGVLAAASARATITPTYAATAGTATAYDGNVTAAAGAGDLILNGSSTLAGVAAPATNSGFGTLGFYDGSTATNSNLVYYANTGAGSLPQVYVFNLSNSATVGYDLSTIQSIGGWGDHSLGNQSFNVFIKTVANQTFTQLGGTFTNSPYSTTAGDSTMTTINDSTGVLASGVTAIEFQLLSPGATVAGSNGGSVYRDVAVLGTATPIFDANTGVSGAQDGSGVWNTTTANFYNSATNTDQIWSNSTNALAAFGSGGTAGTVTVATVNANAIAFNNVTGAYNLTGGTITLGGSNPTITTNSPSATIGSNINSTSLTTNGTGNLTLTGAVTLSAVTFVNAGSVTIAGAGSINSSALIGVGGNAGTVGTLNINTTGTVSFSSAGTTAINTIGCQANGLGVVNQTSGNVQIGGDIALGYVSPTASGTWNLTGTGNLNVQSPNPGIVVGWGGTASFYQAGNSTLNDAGYLYIGGNYSGSGSSGVATFAGGTATLGNSASAFATNIGFSSNATGVMNIGTQAGGNATVTIVNGGMNVGNASGSTGILNLNSGTLALNTYFIQKQPGANSTINMNGATLLVGNNYVSSFINAGSSPAVNLYNGGITVNTNGYSTSLAVPLTPATGGGVYVNGGTIAASGLAGGLTGTPIVTVTDSGTGTGLTAIANVNGGTVNGFTLTSPGQNYKIGDTLTFTISGAGATGSTTFQHTLTSADNVLNNGTGGVTKIGGGTLALSAVNSYSGPTTVTAGAIALGINNAISSSSPIVMAAGTSFQAAGFSDSVGPLTQAGVTIDFGYNNAGSVLQFANSATQSWTGFVTVTNWNGTALSGGGSDQLKFGTNAAALTPAQLADIKFTGYSSPATILSNGEVVPLSTVHTTPTPRPSIMPLGDSITYGQSGNNGTISYPGGYRDPMYSALNAVGYTFNFAGSQSVNSTPKLSAVNESLQEGHSGYKISDIQNNLSTYLGGPTLPSTVLLMIGTNDIATQYDPNPSGQGVAYDAAQRLITLINSIYADDPGVTIYVSSIIPILSTADYSGSRWSPSLTAEVPAYNNLIQSEVIPQFLAVGDSIHFVDNYAAFLNSNGTPNVADFGFSDDEHPSPAGYAVMGQTFANAIAANSVPEPATMSLAILTTAGGLLGRRRRK